MEEGWDVDAIDPYAKVFVFGSNLAGRHGKGAALWARQHRGAVYGQAEGRQGQSYAIPTKDGNLKTLPLPVIQVGVRRFIAYAIDHPAENFEITPIGCGLAGYRPEDISPMFKGCLHGHDNIHLPVEFLKVLL